MSEYIHIFVFCRISFFEIDCFHVCELEYINMCPPPRPIMAFATPLKITGILLTLSPDESNLGRPEKVHRAEQLINSRPNT